MVWNIFNLECLISISNVGTFKGNKVLATNSDFLTPISLQPNAGLNIVDLKYSMFEFCEIKTLSLKYLHHQVTKIKSRMKKSDVCWQQNGSDLDFSALL